MNISEAISRLQCHAGFKLQQGADDLASILHMHSQSGVTDRLGASVADIVKCMETVNDYCRNSSVSAGTQVDNSIPREIVSSVSQICYDCINTAVRAKDKDVKDKILAAAWEIQCAWNALVAGDIDSIENEIIYNKTW